MKDTKARSKEVIDNILSSIGGPLALQYECAHVYPLSVPRFTKLDGKRPSLSTERPAKLYIHIPFCNYACKFCFYSKRIGANDDTKRSYLNSILKEIEDIPEDIELSQLYIGGGTPTAVSAEILKEIFEAVFSKVKLMKDASLTIECSPESLDLTHIEVFKENGIKRISMGIDTLDEVILKQINRRHSPQEALEACTILVENGFEVNLDLIYGFPGQTEESLRKDFTTLASYNPSSFTVYNLRSNEKTFISKNSSGDANENLSSLIDWREIVYNIAKENNYIQTRGHTFVREDILQSSYDRAPCVDGFSAGNQLGLGPSAISHLGQNLYRNAENLDEYLELMENETAPTNSIFELKEEDYKTLYFARTFGETKPISYSIYENTFKSSIKEDFGDVIERLIAADLAVKIEDEVSLTLMGRFVYDLILFSFYPSNHKKWLDERQKLTK